MVDADFQQLVKKGKKTQQEVDSMIQLANEVQYAVLTRNLSPGKYSFTKHLRRELMSKQSCDPSTIVPLSSYQAMLVSVSHWTQSSHLFARTTGMVAHGQVITGVELILGLTSPSNNCLLMIRNYSSAFPISLARGVIHHCYTQVWGARS